MNAAAVPEGVAHGPFELRGPEATAAYGARLADRLPHGATLLLVGPLGAGKTTLVRALVAAAGGPDDATSPSYALVHAYPTPHGEVVHVDAWRLPDAASAERLALDEAGDHARWIVIEWGDLLAAAHPEAWRLVLDRPSGRDDLRIATLAAPEDR